MVSQKSEKQKPWTVAGVPWKSEAAFWGWVRGVLRKGWSRHPVKLEYIKANRKRITNPKPSKRFPEVWGMACTCCGKDTVQTDIEIDHISDTGGTFTGIDDVRDYVAYLFLIDFKSIRAVCKDCHKSITYSQRAGVSVEEARLQRKVLEFLKQDKQIVIDYCVANGYTVTSLGNAAKRRAAVESILKESR